MTINEIARKNHVANSTISGYIKPLNLPTNKVINNINICDNACFGAGAVVVKDIVAEGTYIGVPAKIK